MPSAASRYVLDAVVPNELLRSCSQGACIESSWLPSPPSPITANAAKTVKTVFADAPAVAAYAVCVVIIISVIKMRLSWY
jgi:hypothetical protein